MLGERAAGELEVADVAVHERDLVGQVRAVTGVCQEVVGDEVVIRMALAPVADEV